MMLVAHQAISKTFLSRIRRGSIILKLSTGMEDQLIIKI